MEKEQIVFMHIPKTAGTTLRNIVYAQYGETRVAPIYSEASYIHKEEFEQLADARKDQADVIIGHFGYNFHKLLSGNRPYRFATMLRNPISLCLSLYNHLRNQRFQGIDISLKDMMKKVKGINFKNMQVRLIAEEVDLKLGRSPKEILQTAMSRLEKDFAFVGITERFNESLLLASHQLGWQLRRYERRNITSKLWAKDYAEDLRNDRVSMDLLMNLNQLDMQLYDNFNRRLTENLSEFYPDLPNRLEEFESIMTSPQVDAPNAVGTLGVLQKRRIAGWAKLRGSDTEARVGITINGKHEFVVHANIRREDLLHQHYTGRCGFVLKLPIDCCLKYGDEVSGRIINANDIALHQSPRIFTGT